MKTVFYVGKAYPHKTNLERIKSLGYQLGIFSDPATVLKHDELFDYIIPLDFSSEENFLLSLANVGDLPDIDGLLSSHENYVIFKALTAEHLSLPSISIESARASTDKYLMRQRFLDFDPSITPKFARIDSRESLLNFSRSVNYPLIMKPTNLVKSLLVSKCNNEAELLKAYDDTMQRIDTVYAQAGVTNREPAIIVEEFIKGTMCSVAGFSDESGEVYLCDGIVTLTTAQERGLDDNFLYARALKGGVSPDDKSRILTVAKKGIQALGMTSSPAHVEVIYDEDDAKLVEIGARIGGYRPFMYSQSYGIDLIEQELAIAVGERPDVHGTQKRFSSMYELFPRNESTFVEIKGIKDAKDYEYLHLVARPGQTVGPAKNGYRAVAIIGIASDDHESFMSRTKEVDGLQVVTA